MIARIATSLQKAFPGRSFSLDRARLQLERSGQGGEAVLTRRNPRPSRDLLRADGATALARDGSSA